MKSKTVNSEILVHYVICTPSLKVFCAQWELKKCRNIWMSNLMLHEHTDKVYPFVTG